MMKTKLAALASTLALTLLMSTLWAAPPPGGGGGPDIGTPLRSDVGNGIIPVRGIEYHVPAVDNDGTLMSCADTGLPSRTITDVFDALQPGSPGDPLPPSGIPLDVSNQMSFFFPDPDEGPFEVIVKITVGPKNIFSFNVIGGGIHAINWKAGQYETLIDYGVTVEPGPLDGIDTLDDEEMIVEGMVFSDSNLNDRTGKSQEVSHLDFCLSAVETDPNTEIFSNCLEPETGIPDGGPSEGGCFPAGPSQQVEVPFDLGSPEFANETVTQKLVPARTDLPGSVCIGEFVAKDPRVDSSGNLSGPAVPLNLEDLFDLSGIDLEDPDHFPVDPSGYPNGFEGVWLDSHVVGTPCLAMIFGENSVEFSGIDGVNWAATDTGPTITVTQFAEAVDGMFPATLGRITAPLCDGTNAGNCTVDLQFVEEAALLTNIKSYLVEDAGTAFTSDVFNGSRTKSSRGTFYFINTREACVALGIPPLTLTPEYLGAVQQCKIDLAVRYFFNLETAINEANARGNLVSPSVNRLLRDHSRWLSMIKNGQWDKALDRGADLRAQVIGGTWIIDDFNDQGGLIVRIDNLIHRTEQLQIAEAYLETL